MNNSLLKQPWFLILFVGAAISAFILFGGGFGDDENLVATIDGTSIMRASLENNVSRYMAFDEDQDVEEVRKEVFEGLVNELLLLKEAEKEGISLSMESDEVQEMREEISSYLGGEEGLLDYMEEEDITEEELNEMLVSNAAILLLFDIYAEKVDVSEEDVLTLYEFYKNVSEEDDGDFPEFEEIKDDLHYSLIQEQANEKMSKMIEERREAADIECFGEFVFLCD